MNNNKVSKSVPNKSENLIFNHNPKKLSLYKSIDDSLSIVEYTNYDYDTIQKGTIVVSRDTFKDKSGELKPYWKAVVGDVKEKGINYHREYYINKVQVYYKNFKNFLKKKGHNVDSNKNLTLIVTEQKVLLPSNDMEARYDKFLRTLDNMTNPYTKIKRYNTIMEAPQEEDITKVKKDPGTEDSDRYVVKQDENGKLNATILQLNDQNDDDEDDDEDTVVHNPISPVVSVEGLHVDDDTTDNMNHSDLKVSDNGLDLNDVEVKNKQLVAECEILLEKNKELGFKYNDSLSEYSNLNAEHKKLGIEYKFSQIYLEELYELILSSNVNGKGEENVSEKSKTDKHLKLKMDLGILVSRNKEFTPEKFTELKKNIENLTKQLKAEQLMSSKFKTESEELKQLSEIQAERIKVFIFEKEQEDKKLDGLQTKLNEYLEEDKQFKNVAKKLKSENDVLSKTVQDYEENGQIKDAEILRLNEAIRISEANKTDGDTVHKIRVTDLEQEVEDLNKRFETLKSSHEVELIGKDNEIKNLKEKNIKQAKEHDIALQQEREKFPKKISKKKDENIQLKQQHQQEIEKIKAEHQQEIEKIKAEHSKSFSNKNTSSKEENITSVKDVAAGSIDSNQNVSSSTNGSDPVGVDNNENADLSAVIDEDDCVASDDEEEFGEYGFPEDKSNNNQT